jgi:hypothetical protein
MATNDDVTDVEHRDRELDGGRGGIGAAGNIRGWNDIAHVFDHEQITGLALRDQLRQHPRVRAGNEERMRILAILGKLVEQRPVIAKRVMAKSMNAFDQFLHLVRPSERGNDRPEQPPFPPRW